MRLLGGSKTLTVAVDVVAWGVFHAATGYLAHRLPAHRLTHDSGLLAPHAFEDGGRFYRRVLKIDRWKDTLPEAGDLFTGGISKRHLPTHDDRGLDVFVRETRRAELAHWGAMACGPLFVLWNPPVAAGLLVGYGVGINLPFIAIQRYNRARAQQVLARRASRAAPDMPAPDRPSTSRGGTGARP